MKTEIIIDVKKTALNRYDSQCETAIYAKSNMRPGYRWYVGFGSDYFPANQAEIGNLEIVTDCTIEEKDTYEGTEVWMYRKRAY